jgi:hypothetical protein
MKVVLATGKTGLGITRELAAALLVTAVAVGLKKSATRTGKRRISSEHNDRVRH